MQADGPTLAIAGEAFAALPEFPAMKPLEISDRAAVEACTHALPCSSDHNFMSLWMWDTLGLTRIGRVGQNLVIELADYETHELRTTLLGSDDPGTAARIVLESGVGRLDLVPEFVADTLPSEFTIIHDRDQDDYVLDVELLADLAGKALSKHRRKANKCAAEIGPDLEVKLVEDPQDALPGLFERWVQTRAKDDEETRDELLAVHRLVSEWPELAVEALGLYDAGVLIGAMVYELLPDGAIGHYQKADTSYDGVFPLLQRCACQRLRDLGVRELNFEQDLGIEGLRTSKMRWRPVRFVKKYRVSL